MVFNEQIVTANQQLGQIVSLNMAEFVNTDPGLLYCITAKPEVTSVT